MRPILDIKDLQVSFSSKGTKISALQDISLQIFPGQKVGIVGESGSGKSVFAKTLLKLLPTHNSLIEKGEIWYQQQNILTLEENQLKNCEEKRLDWYYKIP